VADWCIFSLKSESATFSLLGPDFLCWNQKKWKIVGHFGEKMENVGQKWSILAFWRAWKNSFP
jgi:hypothetical protein